MEWYGISWQSGITPSNSNNKITLHLLPEVLNLKEKKSLSKKIVFCCVKFYDLNQLYRVGVSLIGNLRQLLSYLYLIIIIVI